MRDLEFLFVSLIVLVLLFRRVGYKFFCLSPNFSFRIGKVMSSSFTQKNLYCCIGATPTPTQAAYASFQNIPLFFGGG